MCPTRSTGTGSVVAHLSICPSCSLLMEEQLGLTAAFEELTLETETAPPANLESIVLLEFASNRPFHRGRLKTVAIIGTIAAVLVGLAAIPRPSMTPPRLRLQPVAAIPAIVRTADPPVHKPVSKPVRRRAAKPAREAEPFVAG